jgi:hypothetical protein
MLIHSLRDEKRYHDLGAKSFDSPPNRKSLQFIDRNLVDLWALRVLISEIERRREHFHYMGDVIVLIDGCTCHDSDSESSEIEIFLR